MWNIMPIDDSKLSQPVHVTGIEYQGELDKKAFSSITYNKVIFLNATSVLDILRANSLSYS